MYRRLWIVGALSVAAWAFAVPSAAQKPDAAGKDPASASPTPSPCHAIPSPLPVFPPGEKPQFYVQLKDRKAACFQSPAPDETPQSFIPTAGPEPMGTFAALESLDPKAGITFRYALIGGPFVQGGGAPTPRPSVTHCPSQVPETAVPGVPFALCERRIVIRVAAVDIAAAGAGSMPVPRVDDGLRRSITVEVNDRNVCVLYGSGLADDQVGACKVSPPSPSPSPDSTATPWTGEVAISLSLLNAALDPREGLHPYELCTYEGTDDGGLAGGSGATPAPGADCRLTYVFARTTIADDIDPGYAVENDSQNSGGSSTSGSSASSDAHLRATPTGNATSSATAQKAKKITALGTLVVPFDVENRVSFELQDTNLVQSLGLTSNASLAQSLQTIDTTSSGASGLAFNGTNDSSNDFGTIDAGVSQRIIPHPYRDFDPAAASKSQTRAFASTSVLDLKPFDPTQIASLTFGTTYSTVDNDNNTVDLMYFRDGTQNASGTIFHGDKTFFESFGNVALGYTHSTANDAYASTGLSNKYLTAPDPNNVAFPTTKDAPIVHSTNDVVGLGFDFGASAAHQSSVQHDFALYGRYATNGIGHDATAALSYQDTGLGTRVSSNGSSLSTSLIAGFRDISYTYDPLLTPYDMLSGNRVLFARAAATLTQPRCTKSIDSGEKSDSLGAFVAKVTGFSNVLAFGSQGACPVGSATSVQSTVALSVVRARDGLETTYTANGVALDMAIDPQFSIDAAYLDSRIAGSVQGRESGKTVIVGRAATSLLANDASSLSLAFKNGKFVTLSAGVALSNKAGCTSATVCSSPFSGSFTSSGTIGFGAKYGDLANGDLAAYESTAPGSLQAGTSASTVVASNALITKVLGMYHYCSSRLDIAPSISYSNGVPGTGSQFTPGNVTVASLDFAVGLPVGLRVSNTVTTVAPGVAFKVPTHSFSFSILSPSQMIWHSIGSIGSLKCKT